LIDLIQRILRGMKIVGRRETLRHQETCHDVFWTRTSPYKWKSQKVEKEPRIQREVKRLLNIFLMGKERRDTDTALT